MIPLVAAACLCAGPAWAVLFVDPAATNSTNTTAPTGTYAESGWQYQGQWTTFLGTPIAAQYFITAKHISRNSAIDQTFTYLGQSYTIDTFYEDPNSDLRIAHVTTPFPNYATLYTAGNEVGKELVVFGRGTQRGTVIAGKGWNWGGTDNVQRWGTNVVSSIFAGGASYGPLIEAKFDFGFSANEATLSQGDSGGGLFIKDTDGVWKLAGVNFTVSGPYSLDASGSNSFFAALYDQSPYYVKQFNGTYVQVAGAGSFYSTRISSNMTFIQQITGVPEPSTAALLVASGVGLACVRARRR